MTPLAGACSSSATAQWDIPELRLLLDNIIPKASAIVGYDVNAEFPAIGRRTMLVSARHLSAISSTRTNKHKRHVPVGGRDGESPRRCRERHPACGDAPSDEEPISDCAVHASQTGVEGSLLRNIGVPFRTGAWTPAEDFALAGSTEGDLSRLVQQAFSSWCCAATSSLKKSQVVSDQPCPA
jgi:hypothetical protein